MIVQFPYSISNNTVIFIIYYHILCLIGREGETLREREMEKEMEGDKWGERTRWR